MNILKKILKKSVAVSLVLAAALSLPMTANADWVQNGSQWSYT